MCVRSAPFYNAFDVNTPPARLIILASILATGPACAPLARVEVHQPHAGGPQQHLRLRSEWAAFAQNDSTRVLLGFPLPGARRGDKHYHIYLRCPSQVGHYALAPDGPDDIRGFFQQASGRHAGVTLFVRATVSLSGDGRSCSGRFEIECDDGTQLKGDFVARRNDWHIRQFEQSHGME